METKKLDAEGWRTIKVNRKELQIKTVLACGQSFRWKNKSDNHQEEWTGVFAHHIWSLKQEGDRVFYKVHNREKSDLSNEVYETTLKNYFQLDVPLAKLYSEWSEKDPRFAKLPQQCEGIRILKQDPIETTFAFICSANNNISRIGQMVEKLCTFYGEKLGDIEGQAYYDFPRVENLQGDEVEKKLKEEAFGYRAKYIANSASLIVSKGGMKWLKDLERLGYQEARKELQTLMGVGRKVADCICLMGLGYNEAIPVDTHIYKLGKEYLPQMKVTKTLTDKSYTEISNHFRELHGEYCGWAQSVLFSSRLRTFEGWFEKGACGKLIHKH